MIIRLKDIIKLFAITVMILCASFVCSLFLTYQFDIIGIKDQITDPQVMAFYDAKVNMSKAITAVSGGCLIITSIIMLFFYIKRYIDKNAKEMGILKALGYARLRIASKFWTFGLSVFIGAVIGYSSSFLLMPNFYKSMNSEGILPDFTPQFHPELLCIVVIIPTVVFAVLSVLYSFIQLGHSPLTLLRENCNTKAHHKKRDRISNDKYTFLVQLRKENVRNHPILAFFIGFAAFCFSSMMQMTLRMGKMGGTMFVAIVFIIGITLSVVIMLLAVTTVIKDSEQYIGLMKIFGYSFKQCYHAILDGYRMIAAIGFVIGTFYQYVLIKITVNFYVGTGKELPGTSFDYKALVIILVCFVIAYEGLMLAYSNRIKKISLKIMMME
jgi:putative ABC transport system permease protein